MADPRKDLPIVSVASALEWEQWLDEHHLTADGVWLKLAKKGSPTPSPSQAEAVETALCFGWIDGQGAPHDDTSWLQRFTPRRKRSKWSQVNREKATRLIAEGRMRPAGLDQVELAKSDGRWDAAYEPQSTATVPDDLAAALEQSPAAAAFFATLNRINRYAILYRIHDAKRPETRARRIRKFVEMLERGEKIHP
ncbi:MAG: YdeI/OmpD-associated family protein [Actinomycetota bacterium]|nr:YdeI/OmpD-associated family protein [Actinomycetota bacterium]